MTKQNEGEREINCPDETETEIAVRVDAAIARFFGNFNEPLDEVAQELYRLILKTINFGNYK
ncbi:MAG TPA: hypothetical protein DEP87_02710 [Candidatus Pacebacteria bacterium]|nr:hypothetical protein [Candidatus Paceibacterota bacterium]